MGLAEVKDVEDGLQRKKLFEVGAAVFLHIGHSEHVRHVE